MNRNNIIPRQPDRFRTIPDLNIFHDYMFDLFVAHQILIMRGEISAAVTMLEQFRELQIRHIRDEEELLLPLYQKYINPVPPGGMVDFYLREHRQIQKFLGSLLVHLHRWENQNDKYLVDQFDRCFRFKDLIDHHDARERVFLYRLLDQKVSAGEQGKIMDKITDNIQAYYV